MKIAVVLFFFFIIEIFASEIAFLPVILRKDFSENNRIHNISEISLAELSGFYAEENFLIDVSKIKNYSNLLPKTFSKQFLSNKCTELEADYLFLSEVEITDSTSISSRVYNCRGRFVSQNDTVIRADFFNSFEKHIRKTLNFLPEKKKSEPIHGLEKEEIFFLIDPSPGFMEERQNLESLIREIKDISNVSIGLIFPSRKKPKFISPSIGNSEVLNNLANFHKEKIFLEDVRDSIFYSFRNLQESKTKNKKFIIATGSKPKSDPFDFSEVVSSLTRLDYEVYIITGSYFDSTIMEIYKKAGRKNKNGLQYITHYQKLGSSDGLKTIFINDGKVFLTDGFEKTERDFDSLNKVLIPSSQVYSKVAYPYFGNMVEIYESVYQKKVLEKGKVHNNIKSIVNSILQNKKSNTLPDYKKVLIKSNDLSIWLKIPKIDESYLEKEITVKTTFVRDSNNSFGFSNIPNHTTLNPRLTPSMLTFSPREIGNYIKQSQENFLKCFIKGRVYEIK